MFDIRQIQEKVIYDSIKKHSNVQVAKDVVFGNDDATETDNSEWVKSTMNRLEQRFNPAEIKKIRMDCQCGYGMKEKLEMIKEWTLSSTSLEDFANYEHAKEAGLFVQNGALYLKFMFCPCPILAHVDKLETDTWCQCTTGYSKVLFESAWGCAVDVELLKSIKMGHDICLMNILPHGSIWSE